MVFRSISAKPDAAVPLIGGAATSLATVPHKPGEEGFAAVMRRMSALQPGDPVAWAPPSSTATRRSGEFLIAGHNNVRFEISGVREELPVGRI